MLPAERPLSRHLASFVGICGGRRSLHHLFLCQCWITENPATLSRQGCEGVRSPRLFLPVAVRAPLSQPLCWPRGWRGASRGVCPACHGEGAWAHPQSCFCSRPAWTQRPAAAVRAAGAQGAQEVSRPPAATSLTLRCPTASPRAAAAFRGLSEPKGASPGCRSLCWSYLSCSGVPRSAPRCSALLAPEGPQLVRWRSGEADRPCECFGARIPTAPLALAARHGVPSCLAIGRPREQHFVVWGP